VCRSATNEEMDIHSAGLYRWLQETQVDPNHEYYHGWGESREFLIELAQHYPEFEFDVAGTYMLMTPPPSSEIPMPIVTARSRTFKMVFVENWMMQPYYTVSLSREVPGRLVHCGFIEPLEHQHRWLLEHLPAALLYGPVGEDALQMTGTVQNQHMLFG
jgi:hypothetical protein